MDHKFNKGSEWRKWDLHIHSNASDGKSSPYEIIQAAKSKGLSVIALTDHHTAKNLDIIKEVGEKEGISVISGIEFRTEYGQKSVHLIGLFPDEFNGIKLSSKALHDLILSPLNLSETQIISKGKEKDSNFSEEKAFKVGMFLVQVPFKDVANLIHQYGGVVSVHAGSKGNGIDEEMKHVGKGEKNVKELYDSLGTVKEELFKQGFIDICEIKRENDSDDFYLQTFGKPSITASDAHETNEIGNKFVWIKADTTFDGLKQIISEPQERVKIQDSFPENKRSYNVIEKIRFIDKSGEKKFPSYEIGFNPNLNAIIGGKSSGKSLLMHLIAKAVGNKTDTKEYSDLLKGIDIEVFYADDTNKKRTPEDRRIIEFLPQLYIEQIVRDKAKIMGNSERTNYFNNFIADLIQQENEIKELFEEHNNRIKVSTLTLSEYIGEWIKLDKEFTQAKKELLPLGDKFAILNEISAIQNKISELTKKSGLSSAEIDLYQTLTKTNVDIQNEISILNVDESEIIRLNYFLLSNIPTAIDTFIKFETKSNVASGLFEEFKSKIKEEILRESQMFINITNDKLCESNRKKAELLGGLQANEKLLAPILDKNTIQTEIKSFESNIIIEKKKLLAIVEKEKEIDDIKTKRDKISFIESYSGIIESYQTVIELINTIISKKWGTEQTKLTLTASSIFDNKMFVESIGSVINLKSYLQNQFEGCGFSESTYYFSNSLHIKNINLIIEKCISDEGRFDNFKSGRNTEELLRALLKNCNYIDFDIKKGEDSLNNMSEGKKGIVILQLYLSLSKADYPILIDQPEDNLDNRTVYVELNDYIKRCKQIRQIILVSHNANLVVNTDAENIIVANQMGEDGKDNREFRFEYVNGTLENTFIDEKAQGVLFKKGIREHVCEILEGGTDAFRKREEKYHLRK